MTTSLRSEPQIRDAIAHVLAYKYFLVSYLTTQEDYFESIHFLLIPNRMGSIQVR